MRRQKGLDWCRTEIYASHWIRSYQGHIHSNLALCYEKLDDITSFKETAIKCIEVDPNFIKGYYRLSKAFALSWQYDKQLNVLERGLAVESTNEDLLKMYKVAKHCSDHMNKFDKVMLEAPGGEESYLAYFVGGEVNNLPSDTVYASLERPTIPPKSTNVWIGMMIRSNHWWNPSIKEHS